MILSLLSLVLNEDQDYQYNSADEETWEEVSASKIEYKMKSYVKQYLGQMMGIRGDVEIIGAKVLKVTSGSKYELKFKSGDNSGKVIVMKTLDGKLNAESLTFGQQE